MSAFVEECRREWRRLRVPDAIADEMARELEADLRAAETDGAGPEELLGPAAADPCAFAAAWAAERGVARPRRRRLLVAVAIVAVLVAIAIVAAAFSVHRTKRIVLRPGLQVPASFAASPVPDLHGLRRASAVQAAEHLGFQVVVSQRRSRGAQHGTVLTQEPRPGTVDQRGSVVQIVVAQ